jgi:hypothetical protein
VIEQSLLQRSCIDGISRAGEKVVALCNSWTLDKVTGPSTSWNRIWHRLLAAVKHSSQEYHHQQVDIFLCWGKQLVRVGYDTYYIGLGSISHYVSALS